MVYYAGRLTTLVLKQPNYIDRDLYKLDVTVISWHLLDGF